MPTIVYKGKLYMSVEEIVFYFSELKKKFESKKKECLKEIEEQKLIPPIAELSKSLTILDYDFFIYKIDNCLISLKKHLAATQMRVKENETKKKS